MDIDVAGTDWLELEPSYADRARKRGGRPAHGSRSSCRSLKIVCDSCGLILRGSSSALRQGMPTCACGGAFVPGDELAVLALEPETAEREQREREERRDRRAARAGAGRATKQCAWVSCSKFARGEYCPEHAVGGRRLDEIHRGRGV